MRAALLFISVLMTTAPAHAQWVYEATEDAFSDEVTHLALTGASRYGLAFRCSSSNDLRLIYITPEVISAEDVDTINAFGSSLLVRTDDDEIVTLDASLEVSADGNLMASHVGERVTDVARAASIAGDRVALAIDVFGQRMHVQDMPVVGSSNAIDQLLDGCGID